MGYSGRYHTVVSVSRKLATFEKMTNMHESQRFECVIIALSIYV